MADLFKSLLFVQLLVSVLLFWQCSAHRLLLIEEHELLRFKPHGSTWQLILQNPYPGNVIFKESESERFQILFNVSGNGDLISYNLTKDLDSLRVHLQNSKPSLTKTESVDVEALHFLFIYAIGAACLVGLSTASGLFFLICWGSSRRHRGGNSHGIPNRTRESDATKMPLLVSEPPTPHVNKHQFENAVPDGAIATLPRHSKLIDYHRMYQDASGHKRWIHPGSGNYIHNSEEEDFVASTLPLRGSASVRPTGILKRPGGGAGGGGSSSLDRSFHPGGMGVVAAGASLGGSGSGSVGGGSSMLGPSSRCSDSNTDLDSNDSRKLGSVASSSSSRPRHIAREFLDESALSGRTGQRRATPTTVAPVVVSAPAPPAMPAPAGPVCVAAAGGGGGVAVAAPIGLVAGVGAGLAVCGKESPSPLPEPPHFEPGFMYRGGISSAQGSDETSGIISDSDVSSLERQQQSQSSTSSSNNKLSSSLGGTSSSTIGAERYISLDSNDERYIALNVPVSTPTSDNVTTSSAATSVAVADPPAMDMTIPRRGSTSGGVVTSSGPSTPTLRPMVGSYTSSSTLSSASSVQTVLAADEMSVLGTNGGTSSLGRTFRPGISPVPPKRSVSLKGSTSFGEGGLEQAAAGGLDDDDDDQPLPPPPSSATSPRSALKGSRPPGPPINKQLRFTTLTLLALCCLVSSGAFAMVTNFKEAPNVDITIYLPKSLFRTNKELVSVLMYLNATSRTNVEFGKYPRQRVMIYDVIDANHYVSKAMCRTRYSCQHTCDPGLGYKCICERGFELMDNIRCKDTNECLREKHPCTGNRKKCTNLPGHFACDCPLDAKGLTCGDCGSLCKPGFYIWQNCTETQPRVCKACSTCHTGSYVARGCRTNANTECKGCNPLCRSDQYEYMPCTRSTNRKCQSRTDLPGIRLPFRDNIWYEDLSRVVDVSTPNLMETPKNRTLWLYRGSRYSIKLKFERNLNVAPVLEPEDHSRANDNQYYKSRDPRNLTLQKLCPYPLTKYYNLVMRTHMDVMSLARMDHNLPGYRPTLRPCHTYRLFGRAPEVVRNGVPCVQPGRLPGLFGREKNDLLANYHGVYVEKLRHCHRRSQECHRCLQSCVVHMNKTASCRPSAEPGDNGLSPRLEKCFNCCARDNCTAVCQQYFRPNCKPKLCMKGPLLEFELKPTWSETHNGRFFCHMRLRQREPVYHILFWLYRDNVQLKRQPFVALLHPTQEKIKPLMQKKYHFLMANYHTGLSELPVVVGGDATAQTGYRWSDQGTPLVPDVGSSRARSVGLPPSGGIPVWTRKPMALNSASWQRLSCEAAENSLDKLFREQGIDPLVPITQVQVVFSGKYQYRVTRSGVPPEVNFTIPRTTSVLASLFKPTYVHRGDYLRADLIFDRSAGLGGYRWIIRVSGAVAAKPGLFRIKLYQVVQPVGKPLYDYEVGVYQERRFQLEFVVPAPDAEPTYTKAFRILILDTKGSMELHVERPPQNSQKLTDVRRFQASTVPRPDVFPSAAVSESSDQDGLTLLGIPDRLWWGVLGAILILCFLLLVGHLTEPTEMILGRRMSSKPIEEISFDPSCQHRFLFMLYVIFKSIYSFSVTLTALLIVARVLTDLPEDSPSSYENFFSNITVHERLLLDKMDRHLSKELSRQRGWVETRKRSCEAKLNTTYKQLEGLLSTLSASSAWRRAQVHVSRAVLERARSQIRNLSLALQRGREGFEQAAMDAVIQLMSDIKTTHERLLANKWLQGARKIHEMVRAQRSNRPGMRIQPFEQWAKIDVTLSTVVPSLVLSSDLPLPNASELTLDDLRLPSYQQYKEPMLELDRNIWYIRDETVSRGMSGDLGPDLSTRGRSDQAGGDGGGASSAPRPPPVQLTWHHLLGVALTLDALLLLYRLLHALDSAQQILGGAPVIVDCTRSALTRNRKGEVIQPDWRIKLKRTIITTMESDFVPLAVAAAFSYLFVFLLGSYTHDLVAEQTLDAVGFYDNLVLPVHARYRLVNTHIATQAERANQVELAHFERSANARFEQYQFILAEWRDWLSRLERTQCEQLLMYKERDTGIPHHCADFDAVQKKLASKKLVFGGCSLEKVQPKLFDEYDEDLYFDSIVTNSRPFIYAVRSWMANLILVVFSFISGIVLWNLLGATVWFYLRRWNLIRQKELYEVDLKGSL